MVNMLNNANLAVLSRLLFKFASTNSLKKADSYVFPDD